MMRLPKIKLLVGILLILIASFTPSVFLADVLRSGTDTVIGGFDLSAGIVQFFVVLVGAVGASMVKDVLMRSSKQKKWRR